MGNTFLYRMPAGIAGAISRPQDLTVEPQLLDKVQQVGSGKNFTGDCLVRGYVTVNIGADASSVALHGPVYMRVATPSASSPLGAFLAAADGSNTVQITNAYFNGPGDTSGNIELAFNI